MMTLFSIQMHRITEKWLLPQNFWLYKNIYIYTYIYIYTIYIYMYTKAVYMFKKRRIPKGNKLKACKVSFGRPQLVRSNPREMLPLWMLRQDWVVQLRVRPYIDLKKFRKIQKNLIFCNFLKFFLIFCKFNFLGNFL